MGTQSRTVEQKLARIADSQHGVVTRREALGAGVSAREIQGRLRKGTLIRVHPGVYRVGHAAPSVEARYLAAVHACGEGALLSGRPAGWLLGLVKGRPPQPQVTTCTWRRIEGVATRQCRSLDRRDATRFRGVPVTTVPRTLVDLAADLALDDLARACHQAGVLHRTTPRQVDAVLKRRPNSLGAGNLREVMHGDVHVVLSELERRFLQLLRDHGLPLPVTNKPAGTHRVDCRWPEHQLTVELDSYRFHNSRHAWEQGLRREREAHGREDKFRRYTWGDVVEDPSFMLTELRELLA